MSKSETPVYTGHWSDSQRVVPVVTVDGEPLPQQPGLCDEGEHALLDWQREAGAVCLAIALIVHRLQAVGMANLDAQKRAHDLASEFASRLIDEFPADRWEISGDQIDGMIGEIEQEFEYITRLYLSTT